MSNPFWIDAFFKRPLREVNELAETLAWVKQQAQKMPYAPEQVQFMDFAPWLLAFVSTEKFIAFADEHIAVETQLLTEPAGPKRNELVDRMDLKLKNYG